MTVLGPEGPSDHLSTNLSVVRVNCRIPAIRPDEKHQC